MTDDENVVNLPEQRRALVAASVRTFTTLWADAPEHLSEFTDLLADEVRLISPAGSASGRPEAESFFRSLIETFPDLRAEVDGRASRGERLFVQMTFVLTVCERMSRIPNVHAFHFDSGVAVERVAHHAPSPLSSRLGGGTP